MRWISTLAALSLMLLVATAAGPSRTTDRPVALDVVLEGVRYQPAAFNAIKANLDARFTLHYVILAAEQQTMYAFKSFRSDDVCLRRTG